MYTLDSFCSGLKKIFSNCRIERTENNIYIKRLNLNHKLTEQTNEAVLCRLDNNSLTAIIDAINKKSIENYSLLDRNSFEIAIKSQDNIRFSYLGFHDEVQYAVSEHGYNLCLSKASQEYIISIICSFANIENIENDIFYSIKFHRLSRGLAVEDLQEFCDQFKLLTVKINSTHDCIHAEFKRMLNSYLFNIAYNTNIAFKPINLIEPREPRQLRIRRAGQLFPYKSYNKELITYYYQAITASMPLTQYLAYYHVAEFFFQSISEDDAFKKIESMITHPSFSPHNKDNIRNFYDKIKDIMKSQKEEGVWNEKTGLLLCLKRFVPDLIQLQTTISYFDSNGLTYYKENDIPFVGDNVEISRSEQDKVRINFNDTPDTIYTNIRNRVYAVRNAIAHSKEGTKLRYEPFKHDKDLKKEISLIRAIAEEIIINTSKNLEIKH